MAVFTESGLPLDKIDEYLGRLPLEMRKGIAKKVLKKPAAKFNQAYRQQLPKGDPTHTPDLRHLKRLVGFKIYEIRPGLFVVIMGVRVTKTGEGWYAHFVEYGFKHKGGAWVPGKAPLTQAKKSTEAGINAEIMTSLAELIIEAGG